VAAFCVFTLGFIEFMRPVLGAREADESIDRRMLLLGIALLALGAYLGATAPGGGRAMAAGVIATFAGWASARLAPHEDAPAA
jgi:hypothetical protein